MQTKLNERITFISDDKQVLAQINHLPELQRRCQPLLAETFTHTVAVALVGAGKQFTSIEDVDFNLILVIKHAKYENGYYSMFIVKDFVYDPKKDKGLKGMVNLAPMYNAAVQSLYLEPLIENISKQILAILNKINFKGRLKEFHTEEIAGFVISHP